MLTAVSAIAGPFAKAGATCILNRTIRKWQLTNSVDVNLRFVNRRGCGVIVAISAPVAAVVVDHFVHLMNGRGADESFLPHLFGHLSVKINDVM